MVELIKKKRIIAMILNMQVIVVSGRVNASIVGNVGVYCTF